MAFPYSPTHRTNRTFGQAYDYVDQEHGHQWIDLRNTGTAEDQASVRRYEDSGSSTDGAMLMDVRIPSSKTSAREAVEPGTVLRFCKPWRRDAAHCYASGRVISILLHPELGSRNVGRCLVGEWTVLPPI